MVCSVVSWGAATPRGLYSISFFVAVLRPVSAYVARAMSDSKSRRVLTAGHVNINLTCHAWQGGIFFVGIWQHETGPASGVPAQRFPLRKSEQGRRRWETSQKALKSVWGEIFPTQQAREPILP